MDSVDWELDALIEGIRTAMAQGLPPERVLLARAQRVRDSLEELRNESADLASLYEIAQVLAASTSLRELLDLIIERATSLVGAERGFVVLAEPTGGYAIAASRQISPEELDSSREALSSSLLGRVMRDREPVLTNNVQEDGRYELTQSIIMQQIRSVLAVPLTARGELVGAIYVDTRMSERLFDQGDLHLLQAMASQAAMAIRNARLYQDARESNVQLTRALNELRDTQEQLVQAERLAAVGRLAASVAHELRNPLMVMRNALFFLDRLVSSGREYSADVLKRYFAKLDLEIDRQHKIINDLLYFSRHRPRSVGDVDLNGLVIEALVRTAMSESVEVIKRLDPNLPVIQADGDQLQQVLVNLITNAVQAMREGGTLTINTYCCDGQAVMDITDTGAGISEENQAKLFEPFFTTKENGIGLGLAVSKSIIDSHAGDITVCSTEGMGTTFTVRLPLRAPS